MTTDSDHDEVHAAAEPDSAVTTDPSLSGDEHPGSDERPGNADVLSDSAEDQDDDRVIMAKSDDAPSPVAATGEAANPYDEEVRDESGEDGEADTADGDGATDQAVGSSGVPEAVAAPAEGTLEPVSPDNDFPEAASSDADSVVPDRADSDDVPDRADTADPDTAASTGPPMPGAVGPDVTEPDLAEPDVSEPDLAEPDVTAQDLAEPDLAEPGLAGPGTADLAHPVPAPLRSRTPGGAELGGDTLLAGDAEEIHRRWAAIQSGFVDDPRASVADAAAFLEETMTALVASIEQREGELRGEWDRGGLDTEGLRNILRRYRGLLDRIVAL